MVEAFPKPSNGDRLFKAHFDADVVRVSEYEVTGVKAYSTVFGIKNLTLECRYSTLVTTKSLGTEFGRTPQEAFDILMASKRDLRTWAMNRLRTAMNEVDAVEAYGKEHGYVSSDATQTEAGQG